MHQVAVALFLTSGATLVALSAVAVTRDRREDRRVKGSVDVRWARPSARAATRLPLGIVAGGIAFLLVAGSCERSGRPGPSPSTVDGLAVAPCLPQGTALRLSAKDTQYSTGLVGCLGAPAVTAFTIDFDNRDAGVFHNLSIFAGSRMYSSNAPALFRGRLIKGPGAVVYQVPALPPGLWTFHCDVHPDQMFGNFVVPIEVTDEGFEPATATLSAGQQMVWQIGLSDRGGHELVDGSGVFGGRGGALDSGTKPPGSSYVFGFPAAGTYVVADPATGARNTIEVSVQVRPSGEIPGLTEVIWSLMPAPPGFTFDVEIQRPGSTDFVSYLNGERAGDTGFMPDAGPGEYSFRARMRNLLSSAAAGWSTPATVRLP